MRPLFFCLFNGMLSLLLIGGACQNEHADKVEEAKLVDSLINKISPQSLDSAGVEVQVLALPNIKRAGEISDRRKEIAVRQVNEDTLCKLGGGCKEILERYRAGVEYAIKNNNDYSRLADFDPESLCWHACRKSAEFQEAFDSLEIKLNKNNPQVY